MPIRDQLPVYDQEIGNDFSRMIYVFQFLRFISTVFHFDYLGDTWMYGVPSDPLKMSVYREITRARAECYQTGSAL